MTKHLCNVLALLRQSYDGKGGSGFSPFDPNDPAYQLAVQVFGEDAVNTAFQDSPETAQQLADQML